MDTLANMLTSIRNANAKLQEKVNVPFSTLKESIARILEEEGFISSYKIITVQDRKKRKKKVLSITLRYSEDKKPVIKGIKRVSKPSRRVYCSRKKFPKARVAFSTFIISTSRGVLTDTNARREKVGGEVLCQVW